MGYNNANIQGTIILDSSTSGNVTIGTGTNSGTISIGNTNSGAVSLDCGTAGITVGTTANAHTSTFGSTNSTSATTLQSGSGALALTSTNGTWTGNSGTGTLGISTDASATTVNFATGGAAKTITIGNTTSTTGITERVGTGNFSLDGVGGSTYAVGASTITGTITIGGTAETGTITLGSSSGTNTVAIGAGTGATTVNIANGATNGKTVSIATGSVANTVSIGSTNTTSSLVLSSGSGNIAMNSGLTVDSTGRTTNTVQPCFQAHITIQANNVTGDGTAYTILFDTVDVNQGSSYNSGTGIFTAPKTGTYYFTGACQVAVGASHTSGFVTLNSTGFSAISMLNNPFVVGASGQLGYVASSVLKMTSGDTCKFTVTISGGTKTVSVGGGNGWFGGYLIC